MAKFAYCFGVLYTISLVSIDCLPVQEVHEVRQEVEVEPVEGLPAQWGETVAIVSEPIRSERSQPIPVPLKLETAALIAEPSRIQRSAQPSALIGGIIRSHHHHHKHHHYGGYGGGCGYNCGGGGGGGSFAGASAFSGSNGFHGGGGSSASASSLNFNTPFGNFGAAQSFASSNNGWGKK